LYVSGQFAHELAVDPQPERRLSNDERYTDDSDSLVRQGKVDEEEALQASHVGVTEEEVDDEGVAGEGEKKDGYVEEEEYDRCWTVNSAHLIEELINDT